MSTCTSGMVIVFFVLFESVDRIYSALLCYVYRVAGCQN